MPLIEFYNLGSLGLFKDISENDVPMGGWSDGINIRFRNNRVEQIKGHVRILTGQKCKPLFAMPVPSLQTTDDHIIYCSSASAYVYGPESTASQSMTHTDITGTTASWSGSIANTWTGCIIGGVAVVNNQRDPPQAWVFPPNRTTAFTNLGNWTATGRCSVMRSYLQFLVAMNITRDGTRYPYMVKWSSVADPGQVPDSWNEGDATELTGEINLLDSTGVPTGPIVDGGPLKDQFIIYQENAVWAMTFTGGLDVFAFQKLFSTVGLLSRNAWCAVEDKHFFVGQDSCYVHNGFELKDVMALRVRDYFRGSLYAAARHKVYVVHNLLQQEVWVCYPTGSAAPPDRALIWNYSNDTWTIREIPISPYMVIAGTSLDSTGPSEQRLLMLAYSASAIYIADYSGYEFASVTFSSFAQIERLPLGGQAVDGSPKPNFYGIKEINAVWPRVDMVNKTAGTAGNINIYLSPTMRPEETASWNGPYTFNPLTDTFVNCRLSGRYLGIRFQSSSTVGWSLDGFAIDVENMGIY